MQLVAQHFTLDRSPRNLARPERKEPGFASEGRTYALNAKDAGSFMRARGGHQDGQAMRQFVSHRSVPGGGGNPKCWLCAMSDISH